MPETGLSSSNGVDAVASEPATASDEEMALYILDMLIGVRHLAKRQDLKFLAYLVGMAAEEARLLSEGRSAQPDVRKRAGG